MTDATIVIKGRNDLGLAVKQAEQQLKGLLRQGELVGKFFRGGAILAAAYAFERLAENAEQAAEKIGDQGTAKALHQLNAEIDTLKAKGLNVIGRVLGDAVTIAKGSEISKLELQVRNLQEQIALTDGADFDWFGMNTARAAAMREELKRLNGEISRLKKDAAFDSFMRGQAIGRGGGSEVKTRYSSEFDVTDEERAKRHRAEMDRLFPDIAVTAPKITVTATEQMYREMDAATQTAIDRQIEAWIEFESTVADLLNSGRISPEDASARLAENVNAQFEDIEITAQRIEEQFADISEFTLEAMRGMQQGLADFLFDPFEEGLDGMLKGFLDTMRRMVAELLAQELLTSFFGTALGGGVKGFFGGLAGRASGGPVSAGVPYMVGERGKETFVPSTSGYIVPNGGGGSVAVTNHITINDETDLKRSMPAIAAEITRQSVASAKSEMKNDIRRYGRVR
jgi:hypothetical protein